VVLVGGLFAFLVLGSVLDLPSSAIPPAGPMLGAETPVPAVGAISPVFTPEVQYWAGAIQNWASAAGLEPNLVATVMQIESCGDPLALSGSGAMGLFQVMPYHFTSDDDPYDPDTNARRGLDYLRRSLQAAGGEPRLALAGYNGGIGVIGRLELTWALQTQRYAYWGSGIYSEASVPSDASPRLQEWLNTSGLSLCRQASRRLGLSSY
jgi:soluble lytic murein transglycosylase-like protein